MISARLLAAARGESPADLLLTNARLVNVYSGEIVPTAIAVRGDQLAVGTVDGRLLQFRIG